MSCTSPLRAVRDDGGALNFSFAGGPGHDPLLLPCGRCRACRLERSRQWATRCMHEAAIHSANCFITLTYATPPLNNSLDYKHFQDFLKRLRKHFEPQIIRYYMCGEYGEKLDRPHYHACLFGVDFLDKKQWSTAPSGDRLYRSATLERIWPYGFSLIGSVTAQSAGYVARYVMKKQYGENQDEHYRWTDPETGETAIRTPEFNKMSLKPGIGANWFHKYHMDVFPHDHVIVNGQKQLPPRYYLKLYGDMDPAGADANQHKRMVKSKALQPDNSYPRLDVKAQVLRAKLSQLKRQL